MTIAEVREKCKSAVALVPRDLLLVAILILACSASFGLGYLTGIDQGQGSGTALVLPQSSPTGAQGEVVASKSGTRYYFPSCAGASAIADANKVWFISAEAAETAGYTRATNCKSI